MPRRARIRYVSLRSSLVNLPPSIYGPLLERGVVSISIDSASVHNEYIIQRQRPQGFAVHLKQVASGKQVAKVDGARVHGEAYLGWTGMLATSSLEYFKAANTDNDRETVEIDPQLAQGLGFAEGDVVSTLDSHPPIY